MPGIESGFYQNAPGLACIVVTKDVAIIKGSKVLLGTAPPNILTLCAAGLPC